MKTRGSPTEAVRVSGTRGRYVTTYLEKFNPGYGQSWWMWAGRISTWLAIMVGLIVLLLGARAVM